MTATDVRGLPANLMGKSVIALQQAYTSACLGIGVAYISLEMSKESLVRRLVASISRVDTHRARCGFLSAEERRRMLEASADLETAPLFLDESRAHTPAAISAALRKLRTKTPIGLVIVDPLQLMKVTGRPESRHSELSEICHGFKRLAGQMGCVVMLWFKIWIFILLRANWRESVFHPRQGESITVPAGSLITSLEKLGTHAALSKEHARRSSAPESGAQAGTH